MSGPFEQAWMLLKNEGEMPMQNNYPQDPPGMRPPPVEFPPPGMESTTPPVFALRKPPTGNLFSSTGRLSDIPLAEQQEGMMKPVPPARPPVRPELLTHFNFPLTGSQFETPQTADRRMEMEDANRGFDEY